LSDTITRIGLDAIDPGQETQARAATCAATVAEYATAMRDGATFPPVVIFRDGGGVLRIGDGFHRAEASRAAGRSDIEAVVRTGGARDAILHSIESNARHGLRFTNADKRRAVGVMLDDPEWRELGDREIARRVGVSHTFVARVRGERSGNGCQDGGPLTDAERAALARHEAVIDRELPKIRRAAEAFAAMRRDLGDEAADRWASATFGAEVWRDYRGVLLGTE